MILNKLNTMEEAMKMLLISDVLKDAENLTARPSDFSKQQEEYEQKITELQAECEKLQTQLETQKSRIKTLQELSDSKDKTIQSKEEQIQVLQKQSQIAKGTKVISNEQIGCQCTIKAEYFPKVYSSYEDAGCDRTCWASYADGRIYDIVDFSSVYNMFRIIANGKRHFYSYWISVEGVDII